MIRQAFAYLLSATVAAVTLIAVSFCLGAIVGWFKVGYCLVAGCLS